MMITAGQHDSFSCGMDEVLHNELCQRFPDVEQHRVRAILLQCNNNRQKCLEELGRETDVPSSQFDNISISSSDGFDSRRQGSNGSLSNVSGNVSPMRGSNPGPTNVLGQPNNRIELYSNLMAHPGQIPRELQTMYPDSPLLYNAEHGRPNRPNAFDGGFPSSADHRRVSTSSPHVNRVNPSPNRQTSLLSHPEGFGNLPSGESSWQFPRMCSPSQPPTQPPQYRSRLVINRLASPGAGPQLAPSQPHVYFPQPHGSIQNFHPAPTYINQGTHSYFSGAGGDGASGAAANTGQSVFNARDENFAQRTMNIAQYPTFLSNQSALPTSPVVQQVFGPPGACVPMDSKSPDDSKYIQTLLEHQRQRMEKLDQDLKDSYSFHSRLQTDIGNLEINMRERRNSKTSLSGFSPSDIRKLKQENRKLQIEIQLLTREVDLVNNGQTPLGVLDTHELQSFYHNLDSGPQTGATNSGGSSKPEESPPPRPPREDYPSVSTYPGVPDIVVTPPARQTIISPCLNRDTFSLNHNAIRGQWPTPTPGQPCSQVEDFTSVSELEDDDSRKWSCSQCTFLNHELISLCEMCDHPRV